VEGNAIISKRKNSQDRKEYRSRWKVFVVCLGMLSVSRLDGIKGRCINMRMENQWD
jgi:hypothetical protein